MTSPAPVGFPDWQRTFSAARNVLVNVGPKAIVANDVSAIIPVVNMASLLIDFQTSINNGTLVVIWYIDAGGTIETTQDVIDVRTNVYYEQTITVKGPFVQFTVEPKPAGSCTYFLRVSEAASDSVSQVDASDSILIATEQVSIAAGATRIDRPGRVLAGPASFFAVSLDAAAWQSVLSCEFADNGTLDWGFISPKTQITTQGVYLPSVPVRVDTTNNDGVARTFIITVTAKPLYP